MSIERRKEWIGSICLLVTASGWALNWPLMKILLRFWPPLFARGLAGVIAALILSMIARGKREVLTVPRRTIPRLLFASFTNVFAWMGFSTIAMKFVTVGEGALIIYTMPIWAMLLAWPILRIPPTARDVTALVLGIVGVAMLLGADSSILSGGKIIGIVLSLLSAVLFALGNVLNGTPLPIPPITSVAWQVGLGSLAMLILGVLFEHPNYTGISPSGLACFAYMTIVSMGLCYLTWFETLRRLPPVSASTGLLLVPVIAIFAAAIILGESLGLREVAAIALTLGGVTLALQRA
jgi:drug/metabolite transporter (DMT)-like permease